MSYYIGLSVLSNTERLKKKELSAEARRILAFFSPFDENSIAKGEQGRPFFLDREADFNISHSGSAAAVSFITGRNARTGCDIELVKPRANALKIAKVFFCESEINYLCPNGEFNLSRFYEIWTLKECYLKLRGGSVFDVSSCPSFISDINNNEFLFKEAVSLPITFRLYELSGAEGERYILSSAIESTKQLQPEIRWFSQGSFACKTTAVINAAPSPDDTVIPKM